MSEHPGSRPAMTWTVPMVGRRPDQGHRQATFLELFFDLCFVVAVAQAALGLHHAVAEDHVADGVVAYALVFFGVWWAWMNFTWFASAYDTDDVAYRLTTFVQIGGALVFAAGVPRAMDEQDFGVATLGYVIMRLAMVTQWLRAASSDPQRRAACLRYAGGIAAVQVGWVLRLALPEGWGLVGFVALAAAELAVPAWAERAAHTPWHPHHIAERYGLFTIIVLGETVLASTVAVQTALDDDVALVDLATVAVGGLVTVCAMWWLYFSKDAAQFLARQANPFLWGYGHYLVFASAAAVGAGVAVLVEYETHHADVGATTAAAAFTVPVAVYLLALGLLQWGPHHLGARHTLLAPAFGVPVLAATFTPSPVLVTAVLLAALVAVGIALHRAEVRSAPAPPAGG